MTEWCEIVPTGTLTARQRADRGFGVLVLWGASVVLGITLPWLIPFVFEAGAR